MLKTTKREKVITAMKSLQNVETNGNYFVSLKAIYKKLKASNSVSQAIVRGILNKDCITGSKTFTRSKISRSGNYRLRKVA